MASHVVSRLGRSLRGRIALFAILLGAVFTTSIWQDLIVVSFHSPAYFTRHFIPSNLSSAFKAPAIDRASRKEVFYEAPINPVKPEDIVQDPKHSFHLLLPASETNPNFCKTLLSAFILNYPPPTLINYNKTFDEEAWDGNSHTGKIQGIWEYLLNSDHVTDGDMVLVADGYDVWFQLPPEVVIKRYHQIINQANGRLLRRYGMTVLKGRSWQNGRAVRGARFTQSVIYGADKLCWPNPQNDPACQSIPPSILPKDAWGPRTDKDPGGWLNRPRYLNSGTVIGPVADVRAIYAAAVSKVGKGRGKIGDQFVLAEIFGEQEYLREAERKSHRGFRDRLQHWFADRVRPQTTHKKEPPHVNPMAMVLGQRYEFGLGLDYESVLFQTMTHSHGDVEYLIYNDTSRLAAAQEKYSVERRDSLRLPEDIASLRSPFESARGSADVKDKHITGHGLPRLSWSDIPLSTNMRVPAVPALMHFNGEKSYLHDWWNRMWYQSQGRVLLQSHMAPSQEQIVPYPDDPKGEIWWDIRGGKGGAWTGNGEWLSWEELCGGFEDEVFRDGKGRWGFEKADPRTDEQPKDDGDAYNEGDKLEEGDEGSDDDR